MRSYSYLNSAKDILCSYNGEFPFTSWLKQYFKANKKFGGTDRKEISNLCFSYYRLGNAFSNTATDEKLLMGIFLSEDSSRVIQELRPEWAAAMSGPLNDKIRFQGASDKIDTIFPWNA